MKICIIGLGYVGLPLAVALSKHYPLLGFDINTKRIEELLAGHDRTLEISDETLKSTALKFTATLGDTKGYDLYIVTVPTPVTEKNTPDLTPLKKASEMIAKVIRKGAIVVYESTVYPGVTENFCGAIIEKKSGLVCGKDFFLGYSPERINPGDKHHTVNHITKVIAGQTPAVEKVLEEVYQKITKVFLAKNIKTAEAAKVIENTQRDINIAFMNEITQIFNKDDISIYDVLDAAQTKWNFLPFTPGLVGGHCIGVDPYYLASYAKKMGHNPRITLAGRQINDDTPKFFASLCDHALKKESSILVLGLTFKENIPDLRNTKIISMIRHLESKGHTVTIVDPLVNKEEAYGLYGVDIVPLEALRENTYDCIIGAVSHDAFTSLSPSFFKRVGKDPCHILDIKNMWSHLKFHECCHLITV